MGLQGPSRRHEKNPRPEIRTGAIRKSRLAVNRFSSAASSGGLFFLSFGFLFLALLGESFHLVSLRLIPEGLDGAFLGQLLRSREYKNFLSSRLLSQLNVDFGDTLQLLERRTDVLFAAGSSNTGHPHDIRRGLHIIVGKPSRETERHYQYSNQIFHIFDLFK